MNERSQDQPSLAETTRLFSFPIKMEMKNCEIKLIFQNHFLTGSYTEQGNYSKCLPIPFNGYVYDFGNGFLIGKIAHI